MDGRTADGDAGPGGLFAGNLGGAGQKPPHQVLRVLLRTQSAAQQHELITTHAADQIVRTHGRHEQLGKPFEHVVARQMAVVVVDGLEIVHVHHEDPGIVLVQIGVDALQGAEIDQAGQAVPLSKAGQIFNGLLGALDLLGEGSGVIFSLHLLRVRDGLVQMQDLPLALHLFVQDGEAAVHVHMDLALFAFPQDVQPAVDQTALVIHHLLGAPEIPEMKLDAAPVRQVRLHRPGKLLQVPVKLVAAGADDRAVRSKAGQAVEGACVAVGQISRPDFFCTLAKVHEVLLVLV